MRERDSDGTGQSQRDQTDESLRAERDKSDVALAEKREAVEQQEDEVVRVARERADQVVQAARDAADLARRSQLPAISAASQSARDRADLLLEHERSDADGALRQEREERQRYLADFLLAEREATDQDLIVERAQADTAIAVRDEFLATVSHDLRSLLSGLAVNAALLVRYAPEDAEGDKLRGYAARSHRLVGRMNRLVNDLLDVASIEAGKLAVLPERVEVGQIMRDTLDAFEPIAAARHITLDADDALGEPLHAGLDGGRILQVLANLVSNAIKFTPAGGRVSIRVRVEMEELEFAVSDTGIGIPADALQWVFERFRQVRKDPRGLGLGLHISKSIVEAHGGRMWVESDLGVGSTFFFALPVGVDKHTGAVLSFSHPSPC